ncbi:MAG: preprotein translocase subunit SecG [Bacteroidota bacterium]|nr:preprotein translocase subunit SecG [Bacteroidota bacterium]
MTIIFLILIVLASFILGFIVLVQNPKGGGLAGSFAGLSNQFMGVKQTTDVLEKGTWIFAAVIGVLCLASTFFISHTSTTVGGPKTNATEATAPATQSPLNTQPPAGQPTKP